MEKEEIKLEKTVYAGGYAITPVVHSRLFSNNNSRGVSFICDKEPLAVVIAANSGAGTLHLIKNGISPEQLYEKLPQLKKLVQA